MTMIDSLRLKALLSNPDLDIYTVVRMARKDLDAGDVIGALARLLVDADKIRALDAQLYEIICSG